MTTEIVKTNRRLSSWIDAFCQYTDILSSPLIFRRWVAISSIACVLERKVWVRSKGADLYPNLYMILVGPPGTGKGVLAHGERIVRTLQPDVKIAPSSVSAASMIDALAEAKQRRIRPAQIPPYVEYHALSVIATEFGIFLPSYEAVFMNLLTKAYDGELIEDRKRGGKIHILIKDPLLNIAGGTTPSYLQATFPITAWEQGFASRTIFIFAGEQLITPIFDDESTHRRFEQLYADLLNDIKSIAQMFGQMEWEPAASDAITNWHMAGGPPAPDHSRLTYYNTRRTAHLLKLCMIAAVDRGAMVISAEDFQLALGWLLEAETYMPDIFKAMTSGGDSRTLEDTWHFILTTFSKEKERPVLRNRVIHFVQQRVPLHSVLRVIETMLASHMIEQVVANGQVAYKPKPKSTFH